MYITEGGGLNMMNKELAGDAIVRCKNCKHRPNRRETINAIFDLWDFPDDRCPCQNVQDPYYSWMPLDDWFCAYGEKEDDK